MNRVVPFSSTALRISAGVIIWAAHFAVIYGYTGLACARRYETTGPVWLGGVPWVIGLATVIAAAACLYFMTPLARTSRRALDFTPWMSAWVCALALAAIVLEGMTIFWVPLCG